jgi:hypothetical protein
MSVEHKDTLVSTWSNYSLCAQLGNVGSEVERAFKWRQRGKEEMAVKAMYRALELLDFTVQDVRWRK